MANEWRGEAKIRIGGKDRLLRISHHDIVEIEELLGGRSVIAIMRRGDGDSITFLSAVISVGLRHEVKVSPQRVCRWFDKEPGRTSDFYAAVIRAIGLCTRGPKFAEVAAALDKAREESDEDELDEETDANEEADDDEGRPPMEVGTGSPASEKPTEQI